jgi:hypothetical protein
MSAQSSAALARMMDKASAKWTKAKDKERRLSSAQIARVYAPRDYYYLTEIVDEVMKDAYERVSDHGRLPANARQLMYDVRREVLNRNARPWSHDSYFTQNLLPAYLRNHPEETKAWDVVYDDRGHFIEPHTERTIGMGTVATRKYIASWHADVITDPEIEFDTAYPTSGPDNRYRDVLFIEKEGFKPLMEAARIAQRFDLGLMSTKGMSVVAARRLVNDLTSKGVRILVAHDFDLSGFSIFHTLGHDNERYQFSAEPDLIDIGLRLSDVTEMGLDGEPVYYKGANVGRLREYGLAEGEISFLLGVSDPDDADGLNGHGQRVELNAMTSRQFIDWLERKFKEHGVEKVVPEDKVLDAAWRRARLFAKASAAVDEIKKSTDNVPAPEGLAERVREVLAKHPNLAWDDAITLLARD